MRRLLPLALLLSLLALSGCGGSDDEAGQTTTAASEETPVRVGLITDQGQLDDNGFNELAFKGLKRAEKELGIKGRVIESASAADYIPNMTSLARQGYDLVIGVGFAQGDAIGKVAQRFPDVGFAIIDVDQAFVPGKPANVQGLLFREEEVGYLVGYLAGLEEKRRDGRRRDQRCRRDEGAAGRPVRRRLLRRCRCEADPGIKTMLDYSQDWDDQAKCKELALNQIARGSNVIFQVAGGCGLGALNAAGERDRWGIGVDADQSFLGSHILTSAQKGVDAAVFLTIKSVQDGTWKGGGNKTFGLKEEGVGLGKVSPKVPKEDIEKVDAIKEEIAAGKITGHPDDGRQELGQTCLVVAMTGSDPGHGRYGHGRCQRRVWHVSETSLARVETSLAPRAGESSPDVSGVRPRRVRFSRPRSPRRSGCATPAAPGRRGRARARRPRRRARASAPRRARRGRDPRPAARVAPRRPWRHRARTVSVLPPRWPAARGGGRSPWD